MRFRWTRWVILTLIACMAFPGAGNPAPAAAQGSGTALVRIVNVSPDSGQMNVFFDDGTKNALIVRFLAPGETFNYFELPIGSYTFNFYGKGSPDPNASAKAELAPGGRYTVVAYGKFADLQTVTLTDDRSAVARGLAKVRIFHAVVGAPNVDLNGADGKALLSDVPFGAASDYTLLPNGLNTLAVTPTGGADAVAELKNLNLDRQYRYDLFLYGQAGGAVSIAVAKAQTLRASGTNQIRFANYLPGNGELDLVLNGDDAFYGLRYGEATNYALVVAPGDYTATVYRTGNRATPLTTGKITVDPEQSVLLTVREGTSGAEIAPINEKYEPVRVSQGRLQVVNAASDAPLVDVFITGNEGKLFSVDAGESRSVDVGAGVVSVVVKTPTGDTIGRLDVRLREGVTTSVVFFGSPSKYLLTFYTYTVQPIVPMRFVHASGVGAVDVYLDGGQVIGGWVRGATTDYVNLSPGIHEIAAYPEGSDPAATPPLFKKTFDLGAYALTAVVMDFQGKTTIFAYPDNLLAIRPGYARARLIQAAPEIGSVKWNNQTGGARIVANPINFGESSSAVDLAAGPYGFTFTGVNDPNIFRRHQADLPEGAFVTFVIFGANEGDVLTIVYQVNAKP